MLRLRTRQLSLLLSNGIKSGIKKSVIQNVIHRLDKWEQNDEDKDTLSERTAFQENLTKYTTLYKFNTKTSFGGQVPVTRSRCCQKHDSC